MSPSRCWVSSCWSCNRCRAAGWWWTTVPISHNTRLQVHTYRINKQLRAVERSVVTAIGILEWVYGSWGVINHCPIITQHSPAGTQVRKWQRVWEGDSNNKIARCPSMVWYTIVPTSHNTRLHTTDEQNAYALRELSQLGKNRLWLHQAS